MRRPKIYRATKYFEFDDFIDGDAVERKLDINWSVMDELECDVECSPCPYVPATRIDPPEGGYLEDLRVHYNGIDLTEDLTELAYEILYEALMEESADDGNIY